jgi:hypothetical protein
MLFACSLLQRRWRSLGARGINFGENDSSFLTRARSSRLWWFQASRWYYNSAIIKVPQNVHDTNTKWNREIEENEGNKSQQMIAIENLWQSIMVKQVGFRTKMRSEDDRDVYKFHKCKSKRLCWPRHHRLYYISTHFNGKQHLWWFRYFVHKCSQNILKIQFPQLTFVELLRSLFIDKGS